jgi:hypothetical protein
MIKINLNILKKIHIHILLTKMEIKDDYKALLLVMFVKGHPRKSSKSTMLDVFSSLFYGFELLKGNIYDQDEPPNGEFTVLMVDGMPFLHELTNGPLATTRHIVRITRIDQSLDSPIIRFILLSTFCHHQAHNYLWMLVMNHKD